MLEEEISKEKVGVILIEINLKLHMSRGHLADIYIMSVFP